jgi:uncharacterized lipoprotein YajG
MKKFGKIILSGLMLVVASFLFFGCKTTKQTIETKTDVSEQKNVELNEERENNTKLLQSRETNDRLNISSDIVENMLVTIWSVPDSSGIQYPVVTSELNRKISSNQTKETDTNISTNLSIENKEKENLRDKSKIAAKYKKKETIEETKKIPSWMIWSGIILIIGGFGIWKLKH